VAHERDSWHTSWNPAYVTASGGTEAGAEAALATGLAAGMAYFTIDARLFPSGGICAFLAPPPDLTLSTSHVGIFLRGQSGAQYGITVTNSGTSATVSGGSEVDTSNDRSDDLTAISPATVPLLGLAGLTLLLVLLAAAGLVVLRR
jgi:hypothetical protein